MKEFKLKPQVIPEKQVENQILHYLWRKHVFAWKNQSVGIFDAKRGRYIKPHNPFHIKGTSDVLGVLPGGRILAIEVKSAVGRLSPEQTTFLDKINAAGGLAFMARSLKDVAERLFPEDLEMIR